MSAPSRGTSGGRGPFWIDLRVNLIFCQSRHEGRLGILLNDYEGHFALQSRHERREGALLDDSEGQLDLLSAPRG